MKENFKETVPGLFFDSAARCPEAECLASKMDGRYKVLPYWEFAEKVERLAAVLHDRGVKKGDRIALMSGNRPEWPLWDLAAMSLGAVTVPIYPTLTPKQVFFILNDCRPKLFVLAGISLLEPLFPCLSELSSLEELVLLDPPANSEDIEAPCPWTTAEILLGSGVHLIDALRGTLFAIREAIEPDDLSSIVYTSGTTGEPKGVMLTHRNLASDAVAMIESQEIFPTDRCLSFLPLSHALERMTHITFFAAGGSIFYAENANSVVSNMPEAHPTMVICVPRVFEKVRSRILENMLSAPFIQKNVFFWALRNGKKKRVLGECGAWLNLKVLLADLLVFRKIRARFGGRIRYFVSGGAALVPAVGEFFEVLGIEILEGYGLTETSPAIASTKPRQTRLGTVGFALPGVSLRLADDGEIQVKGPIVMKGYYNRPDLTDEVLKDGWFSTGDIGEFDADGYLKIVDRKKEILVTSNGKNVAPQPIENALKKSKFISMAMVVGEGRNYLTALLVPNIDPLLRQAQKMGISEKNTVRLLKEERILDLYRKEVDRLTSDFARFEKIKNFILIPEEFSQERDEMTPTLKYKRANIIRAYAERIEAMYGAAVLG